MRRFHVLACDYDGTLARHGKVDASTMAALERVRASGRRLVMVTGRRLAELLETFSGAHVFDRLVVENGAVVYDPSTGAEQVLAEAPSPRFIETLRERGVGPIAVGHTIVATWEPHGTTVLEVIRDLGLGMQIILNKGAVMVLPGTVSKATGLEHALGEFGLSPRNAVAVGDAENDHVLLNYCECGAAVSNAVQALKDRADVILERDHGDGVIDLIEQIVDNDLARWMRNCPRRRLELGITAGGDPIRLATFGAGLTLESSEIALQQPLFDSLIQQWNAQGYQWCAVSLASSPLAEKAEVKLGSETQAPAIDAVIRALDNPRQSISINCAHLNAFDQGTFLKALANAMAERRRQSGRPHWVCWIGAAQSLKNAGIDLHELGAGMVFAETGEANGEDYATTPQRLRLTEQGGLAVTSSDTHGTAAQMFHWLANDDGKVQLDPVRADQITPHLSKLSP
jgi:HAD superfamily hydrolase (TIGR01484 family)